MTPYTQTQIQMMRQEWLEKRLTSLFIFILRTFLCYHICLSWRAVMYINLYDYMWDIINTIEIWYDWLRLYHWISPHDHPGGSVDWELSRPSAVTSVGDLTAFSLPRSTMCLSLWIMNMLLCLMEGWESWGVMVLNPEWLDIAEGWLLGSQTWPDCWWWRWYDSSYPWG